MKINSNDAIVKIDWKSPLLICLIYVICCLIYENLFTVPGSISFKGIITFMLPYLGSALALKLYPKKIISLNKLVSKENAKKNKLEKYYNIFIFLLFLLQIITWAYILNESNIANTGKEYFTNLRLYSINLNSIVPVWLSYPNGLCFSGFCIAIAKFRIKRSNSSIIFLILSILTIFLNDLQTAGRAGMVFVLFAFIALYYWDWRVNHKLSILDWFPIVIVSLISQLPKIIRAGYQSFEDIKNLLNILVRYCFSYLNTLSELLERVGEPNMIGKRTLLPIYNLLSKFTSVVERAAAHGIEKSNVWGYNNYTMSGDFLRDFSYLGCFIIPFIITIIILFNSHNSSPIINLSLSLFYITWLIYGTILNIFILGGFFISILFLITLSFIEKYNVNKGL